MLEEWYHPPGRQEKLAAFVRRDSLEAALRRFQTRAEDDPLAAGRELMQELFGGYAREQERRGWVEMTPINAMWGAPHLARLFPELRFLNVTRDGRDVASSLISVGWASDPLRALGWWEERMLRGHEQCRALPAGSLLTVRFERLLVEDREAGLQELLAFMEWEPEPSLHRFFIRRMPVEDAHVGRWKSHFTDPSAPFSNASMTPSWRAFRAPACPHLEPHGEPSRHISMDRRGEPTARAISRCACSPHGGARPAPPPPALS